MDLPLQSPDANFIVNVSGVMKVNFQVKLVFNVNPLFSVTEW